MVILGVPHARGAPNGERDADSGAAISRAMSLPRARCIIVPRFCSDGDAFRAFRDPALDLRSTRWHAIEYGVKVCR